MSITKKANISSEIKNIELLSDFEALYSLTQQLDRDLTISAVLFSQHRYESTSQIFFLL